jgi:hypothetical protein
MKIFIITSSDRRSHMFDKGYEKKEITITIVFFVTMFVFWLTILSFGHAAASQAPERAKFYDFSEQLIDGQVKRPTALYTDVRRQAQFKRLLKIKRSFMPQLLRTSKDPVFR